MHVTRIHSTVVVLAVLFLISSTVPGVDTQEPKTQKNEKTYGRVYDPAKVTTAPKVVSKIPGLEISSVNLIDQGTPEAAIEIHVTNTRNEAVMAVDFITSKNGDSMGQAYDGLLEEDNPRIVIPPNTLKTFTFYLGGFFEGEPINLEAAIFSDGKEEGAKRFLNGLKADRRHSQQSKRPQKGGPQ